jgi:hypothetical protein
MIIIEEVASYFIFYNLNIHVTVTERYLQKMITFMSLLSHKQLILDIGKLVLTFSLNPLAAVSFIMSV